MYETKLDPLTEEMLRAILQSLQPTTIQVHTDGTQTWTWEATTKRAWPAAYENESHTAGVRWNWEVPVAEP